MGGSVAMVHIVRRPAAEIFADFEDVDPRSVLGGGDVKYHVGATGEYRTTAGHTVEVHLVSNPSHLEAVDPVAMGRARAKQARIGQQGRRHVLPVTIHGDAAFAGQGIWAETLNMDDLSAYSVGWNHSHHREQLDWLHHAAPGAPFLAFRLRPG